MKKIFSIMAMLTMVLAMQAQNQFYDVESIDAKGPVKSVTIKESGATQTISFSKEGKRTDVSNAVYDANGYLLSGVMDYKGQKAEVSYTWENGRVKTMTVKTAMLTVKTTRTYDAKGLPATESIDMGGMKLENQYYDYKFDKHGNWISRKTKVMGMAVKIERSIVYYE